MTTLITKTVITINNNYNDGEANGYDHGFSIASRAEEFF